MLVLDIVDASKIYALSTWFAARHFFLRTPDIANRILPTCTSLLCQEGTRRTVSVFMTCMGCFGMTTWRRRPGARVWTIDLR